MYELITIRQFEKAYFNKDFSEFSEVEIEQAYTEYIDTAGLFETEEFQKVTYIHYLNNRLNSVKLSVQMQTSFIEEFGIPYLPGLVFLKKFGHRVEWKNNKEEFISQLNKCIQRDNKYVSILESKVKEIIEDRKKKHENKKEVTVSQSRGSWIRTTNTLGKIFSIDKDKTTLEEYSWMIKQQTEDNKK